jgi:nucleoside-diphosphate-sugar epimerase
MKEAILITGANGFIGTALAKRLRSDGYQIIGFDITQPKEPENFDLWLKCDLTDGDDVENALSSVKQKYSNQDLSVIHLAAYYDFSGADSPLYEDLTIDGTKRLLGLLQPFRVKQFQFASTILVMDEARSESQKINEESATNPKWKYPESKLAAEQVIKKNRGHIPAVIHRVAGVYNDWCHSPTISEQIVRIFERSFESYFFPGNSDHGQPFIHIDDLVGAFQSTLEKKESLASIESFVIGEESVLSYEDLQNVIGDYLYQKEWPTIRIPKTAAKVGAWLKDKVTEEDEFIQPWMVDLADAHFPIDISKAKEKLNWTPSVSLRYKIPTMIDHLLNDPKKWYRVNDKEPESIPRRFQKASESTHSPELRSGLG